MAFNSSLRLPSSSQYYSHFCSVRFKYSKLHNVHSQIDLVTTKKRKCCIKSILNDNRPSINDYGAAKSARLLLEKLFEQAQKLEHQMATGATGESYDGEDAQLAYNLSMLESDLQAALRELIRKEEHLMEVERTVILESTELKHTKEELEQQEREIAAARTKYEKLEEEMKEAKTNLVSQAGQMEVLKLLLRERDQEVATMKRALSLKEAEVEQMKIDVVKKSEEAALIDAELKQKAQLLIETNEVMNKQKIELQELQKAVHVKEQELEVSLTQRKFEEEKLKSAEATLEQQAMEWLLAQEELKRLGEDASRHVQESNETLEDFRRVKKLLSDVRSELVSSQQSLASSRGKMEEQERLLEQQLSELAEQRENVMSYMASLNDAQVEVEGERAKLRIAEARNRELERDLTMEKELVVKLLEELRNEGTTLKHAVREVSFLQQELEKKSTEFNETSAILHAKETELVDAKMEIQHFKSEKASLQAILEEKDLELSKARKTLAEVNNEISDLKLLLRDKEAQLIEATCSLKEKDERVKAVENILKDTNLKASQAEAVLEKILDVTNKLVASIKDEDINSSRALHEEGSELLEQLIKEPDNEVRWQQKRLESELQLTKDNLKAKEMEVLAAHRALTIKDEELKMTLARLDAKEEELKKVREKLTEDTNDLKRRYALTQEKIGENSMEDLAVERLQLEAAQSEVEAATSALHKLAEMRRQLLTKAIGIYQNPDSMTDLNNACFAEVKEGIARLSAMTDQLVREVGIVSAK
ncbi:hypothetical protein HN51_041990 [Arachis hypogaea]|uniref:Uncharacterized protein n=2 Tax=Arachis TaxID=3817 RepID=A0A444YV47_ARAHY|nr:myosin-9 [Arachis hypogaea]QHN87851.1 uncharacterized protein DS421_16g558640 [Arachis hypogaea]RYR05776.1 hypothetical protein Ahy_B06g085588 [Arachis hypogaea]